MMARGDEVRSADCMAKRYHDVPNYGRQKLQGADHCILRMVISLEETCYLSFSLPYRKSMLEKPDVMLNEVKHLFACSLRCFAPLNMTMKHKEAFFSETPAALLALHRNVAAAQGTQRNLLPQRPA